MRKRLSTYCVVGRFWPVLISGIVVFGFATMSLYYLLFNTSNLHPRALGAIPAGLFSLWSLRLLFVYSLRLEVNGETISVSRLGRRRTLPKDAIGLEKVSSNGLIRTFHFKSTDFSFSVNENFRNAGRFVNDIEATE